MHVIQRNGVRNILNHVDDVIQRVDELLDLIAIQRRDEGLVQQIVAVASQFIGRLFVDLDVSPVSLRVVEILDQLFESMTAVHDISGMGIENLEKIAVSGHESAEHRALPRV
ncbi:hypothetical protein PT2222_170188 [Paraburkholderia tropica]